MGYGHCVLLVIGYSMVLILYVTKLNLGIREFAFEFIVAVLTIST
jgi:hypothetical protein